MTGAIFDWLTTPVLANPNTGYVVPRYDVVAVGALFVFVFGLAAVLAAAA